MARERPRCPYRPEEPACDLVRDRGQSSMPWWAKSVWTIGPLGVVVVLLIASLVGLTPVKLLNGNGKASAESRVEMLAEWKGHVTTTDRVGVALEHMQRLMRQVCMNTAKDSAAMSGCNQ